MKFGVREICDVVFKAKKSGTLGSHAYNAGQPVLYIDSAKASTIEGAATAVYAQGGKGNARLISWEGEKTLTFTVEDALLSDRSFAILSGADLIKKNSSSKTYVHRYENRVLKLYTNGTLDSACVGSIESMPQNVDAVNHPVFIMGIGLQNNIFSFLESWFTYKKDSSKIEAGNSSVKVGDWPIDIQKYVEKGIKEIPVIVDYYLEVQPASVGELTIDAGNFAGNWYVEAETSFRRQSDGKDLRTILTLPNVKIQSNFTFSMAATGDPSTFTFTMDALPGYTMNNKTKQVLCEMQILDEEIGLKNIGNKDDSIFAGSVTAHYTIFEDEAGSVNYETNTPLHRDQYDGTDKVLWTYSGYQINNKGESVLTISNTIDELTDIGYYIGTYNYNGQVYDQWQVIEAEKGEGMYDWDNRKYILTDKI